MKHKAKKLLQSLLLVFSTAQINAGEILITGEKKPQEKSARQNAPASVDSAQPDEEALMLPRGGAPAEQRQYEAKIREQNKPAAPDPTAQDVSTAVVIMQTPNGPVPVRPARRPGNSPGVSIEKARVYADRPAVNPDIVPPPSPGH